MRALDAQLYPEKLKAIAQQVQDQQSLVQLQQHKQLERDSTPAHSPQVGSMYITIRLTRKQNYAALLMALTLSSLLSFRYLLNRYSKFLMEYSKY